MNTILEIKNLKKYFPHKKNFLSQTTSFVRAVDGVNLHIKKGEALGLVGESGCGKSTLGRTIIRLYEPTDGSILFKGQDFGELSGAQLRKARRDIQMIFQDPTASLDPRMTVGQILTQPMDIHDLHPKHQRLDRAKDLLETVGLQASHCERWPHQFSGGQRQRINIARALAVNPELIIADEPVSSLDASVQAQILNLLKDLQDKFKLTFLFISHDLKVVEHFCDRVAVMYLGRIVETATREEIYQNPNHPYTQALLSAIPQIGSGKKKIKRSLSGEVPSAIYPPSGCHFHPRCSKAMRDCTTIDPQLLPLTPSHHSACLINQSTHKEVVP
ncbi:MAG: hypothetical protein RJB66_1829 [Pseudomonadota bacterium]